MGRPKSLELGDIVGKGNLEIIDQKTIIEGKSKTKRGYSKVYCKICGSRNRWIRNNHLKRDRTISCGCSQRDSSKWKSIGPKKMGWRLEPGEAAFNDLYYQYKRTALQRNLDFSLSEQIFRDLTKQNCYYCGREPHRIKKGQGKTSGDYIYNGIDRVDNSLGYTKTNVVSCCFDCNSAKNCLSTEEFLQLIENIYNKHIRK